MFLLDFQILWVWLCSPNLRQTWIFTFIDILKTIVSPLSLTWYVIALFLSYSLDYHFYTRVGTLWCICMLCYESLMSFRLIGLSSHFVTILLSPYLFYFIIIIYSFSFFSLSLFASSYYSLPWVDDSSRLSAMKTVISLYSFHHLTLIRIS